VSVPSPSLLVVTDRRQAHAPLAEVLTAAFAAGCRWASVREKDLPADQQVALAAQLLPLARRYGARLTLHGDSRLAEQGCLDGVHLPAGGDARGARKLLGRGALIGISVHTPEETAKLDPAILDYAIAGPAYASASKPGYGPMLGLAGIAAISAISSIPVIAIGGVAPGLVAEMLTAGAAGIAVMGGVMRATDPGEEVKTLLAALAAARWADRLDQPSNSRI
jgi:thiamine-phosphate pyrophosphorylase